ncbi:hypothetical protein [Vreelandella stevensii]|uniref:hypothetical protein n=1 Tax=Vreelandella stevensii TaxID=502821 RepID=UPI00403A7F58
MPTLNLGRVRFNWRGEYNPLADYQEYDTVKADGQSYVCIGDVSGVGPLDPDGGLYWDSMLVRGADYNAARDQALQAASDSEESAALAGTRANEAGDAAAESAASMEMAERWASEEEDIEVSPGQFSAYHWSRKAQSFGDPNEFQITADQTEDTRTLSLWMAQALSNQQQANDNAEALASLGEAATRGVAGGGPNSPVMAEGFRGLGAVTQYGKSYSFETFPINGSFPDTSSNMSIVLCKKGVPGTSIQGRFVFGRAMSVTSTYRNIIADVSYQTASDGTDGGRAVISGNNGNTFSSPGIYSVVMTYVTIGGEDYVALTALNNSTANPLRTSTFSFSGISSVPFEEGLEWVTGSNVSNVRRAQSDASNNFHTIDGYQTYTARNILGTVSQSGGVPTGAIIEEDSNSFGTWTKFAGGRIFMVVDVPSFSGGTEAVGGLFRTDDLQVTLPQPLDNAKPAHFNLRPNNIGRWGATGTYSTGSNSITCRMYSPAAFTTNLSGSRLIVAANWM